MAPLHVWSKVCNSPIHVRSKYADFFNERSKVRKFAPPMDGSNTDFALHMERRQADFASRMERRHSSRDQIIVKTAIFGNFHRELLTYPV